MTLEKYEKFVRYLQKSDKILDLGCGSGRDSAFLAEHGFYVWGADISTEAIKKAKEKSDAKNVQFSVGDVEDLKFKDEFFDALYSSWVLQSVPLKKASIEIYRVLKKGGIAFLAFLLNSKIIATEKLVEFHKKADIISNYSQFEIIEQIEYVVKDLDARMPHTHDALIIVLRK